MKTISKTALVALMTSTIGLTAIAPTFAQESAAPARQHDIFRNHHQGPRGNGPTGGGDFLSFERGAEAIEIALVRLSHRLELTAEQQPLFDTFKAEALSAAASFASAVEVLRPAPPAEGATPAAPDLADRLDNAIAIQAARLAALEAVQPSATAFFDSLTADQLAGLAPQRPDGMRRGFGKGGDRRGPGMPNQAPADAPTPPPANG